VRGADEALGAEAAIRNEAFAGRYRYITLNIIIFINMKPNGKICKIWMGTDVMRP
jgi:hypothetical protein